MTPTNVLLDRMTTLITDDTVTLGLPDEILIALIMESFTPSPTLVFADLVLATFTGSTPKNASPAVWGVDPATGNRVIQAVPPVGGYHWETGNATNLPQTIFGYVWYNQDNVALFATALMAEPVTLDAANQFVDVTEATLTMTAGLVQ